jgi:hypothetical protein
MARQNRHLRIYSVGWPVSTGIDSSQRLRTPARSRCAVFGLVEAFFLGGKSALSERGARPKKLAIETEVNDPLEA